MGLLQRAKVEQSAAKVGLFGRQASGKTTTAALILIGLSKTYHKGAPVAALDTENGSDYLVPIFEAEGVELRVVKSRAFRDMKTALVEAEEGGCCGYLVDSYTHPWNELCDTFKKKSKRKRLEFTHMDQLKSMWRVWTDMMLNSPLHVLLSGRLGFEWGEEEDQENPGERKLVRLGTKLKSESEAGYEPSLLIEMEALQDTDARQKKTRTKKGSIVHHCYVLKDRWRALNGRTFEFKDINSYKVGDYKKVFEAFMPHWSKLVIGAEQRAVNPQRTSAAMFDDATGESIGAQMARRQQIAAEEISGILQHLWPSAQATAEKRIRQAILHELFDTFSWHAIETAPVAKLEKAVDILRQFKGAAEVNLPATAENAIELLRAIRRELYGDPAEAATGAAAGGDQSAQTEVGTVAPEEALAI
jgi:hypothetical protein